MSATNFLDMPVELLYMITDYIQNFTDLVYLGKTCVLLKNVCERTTKKALLRLQNLASNSKSKSAFPAAQLTLVLYFYPKLILK